MSDSMESQPTVPQRAPRAWWQYVIAAVMFLGAGWFLIRGYVVEPEVARRFEHVEPRAIKVDPKLAIQNHVPAKPGDLAGANVLLVTFDTTRADRIGCYGNDGIETPHLDRLANNGVIFSQAVATAPTTLPSHTSIMTGLFPFHHGARANANYRVGNDKTTMAEILQGEGYETAAFVSAMVLQSSYGLDQGFDSYMDDVSEGDPRPWTGDPVLPGDKTTGRALEWLTRHGERPFFVWVHYFDPHAPHEAPPPYDKQYSFNYDGEIAFTDEQLGRLMLHLEQNKLDENTLVVVAADHGESLGQHKELTHGFLVHNSTLHIPMLMACGKRLAGGVNVSQRVSQVDLMPTILSLLGVDKPAGLDGRDLTSPIPPDRALYSDTLEGYVQFGMAPLIALFDGNFKYIHGPSPELYDLTADPYEMKNVIDQHPKIASKLSDEIKGMVGEDVNASLFEAPTEELDAQTRAKLEALGYVREGAPQPGGTVVDPKEIIELSHRFEQAVSINVHRSKEESIEMMKELVEKYPDFAMGYRFLGDAYYQAEDFDDAEDAFLKCIELHPTAMRPRSLIAQIAFDRGDYETAERYYREALDVGPGRLALLTGLAATYSMQGKLEDAITTLQLGFDQHPSDPEITEGMVGAMMRLGQENELRRILRDALDKNPRLIAVRNALAGLQANTGDRTGAVELLREGLEIYPDTPELIVNLGLVLATSMNDREVHYPIEATVLLERVCEKTKYSDPRYLHTLSLAYWSMQRVEEAEAMAERAKKLAEDKGDERLVASISGTIAGIEKAKKAGASPMHRTVPSFPKKSDSGPNNPDGASD